MSASNPWGLTPYTAEVLDAVIETGSRKGAARKLNISHKAVEGHTSRARVAMNLKRDNVRFLIAWDRWRQANKEQA